MPHPSDLLASHMFRRFNLPPSLASPAALFLASSYFEFDLQTTKEIVQNGVPE